MGLATTDQPVGPAHTRRPPSQPPTPGCTLPCGALRKREKRRKGKGRAREAEGVERKERTGHPVWGPKMFWAVSLQPRSRLRWGRCRLIAQGEGFTIKQKLATFGGCRFLGPIQLDAFFGQLGTGLSPPTPPDPDPCSGRPPMPGVGAEEEGKRRKQTRGAGPLWLGRHDGGGARVCTSAASGARLFRTHCTLPTFQRCCACAGMLAALDISHKLVPSSNIRNAVSAWGWGRPAKLVSLSLHPLVVVASRPNHPPPLTAEQLLRDEAAARLRLARCTPTRTQQPGVGTTGRGHGNGEREGHTLVERPGRLAGGSTPCTCRLCWLLQGMAGG